MRRLALFLIAFVALGACSGGDEGETTQQTQTASKKGESRAAIPAKEAPKIVGEFWLRPFFDPACTQTELTAGPGEEFAVYVAPEFPKGLQISAAEFALKLPDGVKVLTATNFTPKALSMGSHDTDYMLGFQCTDSLGYLVRFDCTVEDGFSGGEVAVTVGTKAAQSAFLGLVSCGAPGASSGAQKHEAKAGTATLATK